MICQQLLIDHITTEANHHTTREHKHGKILPGVSLHHILTHTLCAHKHVNIVTSLTLSSRRGVKILEMYN